MACPLCKEKRINFSVKVKDYEYDINNISLYNCCKYCNSIYRSRPIKLKNQKKKYYSKKKYLPLKGNFFYDFFKKIYATYEQKKIIEMLDNNFIKKKNKIMDIACGKGYLIKKFHNNYNFDCYGTDISINNNKSENINFIKTSYNNFNLIKKIKPDLIIINNFIEHIEDLKIIKKILSKMKERSHLAIITIDANSSGRKYTSSWIVSKKYSSS